MFESLGTEMLFTLPLLLLAAGALTIIVERYLALESKYPMRNQNSFFDKIKEFVSQGDTESAISLCESEKGKLLPEVVKSGLLRAHMPEEMVENALDMSLGEMNLHVQKRTNYLSTIANVATLTGLFGTIAGLVQSFEAIAHADAQQKSTLLAEGIATAMNTTMMGIGVAIPCMLAFSYLVSKSNRLVSDLENGAVRTVDLIKQSYYQIEDPKPSSPSGKKSA